MWLLVAERLRRQSHALMDAQSVQPLSTMNHSGDWLQSYESWGSVCISVIISAIVAIHLGTGGRPR